MLSVHRVSPQFVEITASGQLTASDLDQALPALMEMVQQKGTKIHALVVLDNVEGWSGLRVPQSLHDLEPRMLSNLLERIAVVANPSWQTRIRAAAYYLPAAEIRLFAPTEAEQARQWAQGGG